jgi:hypothetical protein
VLTLENSSGRFDGQSRFVSQTFLRMDRTTGENDDVYLSLGVSVIIWFQIELMVSREHKCAPAVCLAWTFAADDSKTSM